MRKFAKKDAAILLGSVVGGSIALPVHELAHAAIDYYFTGIYPSIEIYWNGIDTSAVTNVSSSIDSVGKGGMAAIDAGGSIGNYIAGGLLGAASEKIKNPYKRLFVKGAAIMNILTPAIYSVTDLAHPSAVGDFTQLDSLGIPFGVSIPLTGLISLGASYLLLKSARNKPKSRLKQENGGVKEREDMFKEYSGKVYESLSSTYEKARNSFKKYI